MKLKKRIQMELLKNSNSINEFTQVYFKRPIDKKNAKIWIEKTPSNAYSFTKFLDQYPNGKVVAASMKGVHPDYDGSMNNGRDAMPYSPHISHISNLIVFITPQETAIYIIYSFQIFN